MAFRRGEDVDARLRREGIHAKYRSPTGASGGDPTTGGFIVPQVFADGLVMSLYKTGAIASRCDRLTTDGQITDVVLPAIDESSRASGSRYGGSIAYFEAEG